MIRRLTFWCVLSSMLILGASGCRRGASPPTDSPPQPVRSEEARLEPFSPRLHLFGVVEAGSSTEIFAPVGGIVGYSSRFSGGLRSGATVARGEPIARIDNEGVDLVLREARLRDESARSELERHRRAFEAGVESEAQLEPWRIESRLAEERLRAAERERDRLVLRSAVSGRLVVDSPVPPGAEIPAGTRLARVVGDGARKIEVLASAEDLELLAPGQTARIRVPGEEEVVAEAVVAELPPGLGEGGVASVGLDVVSDRGLPAIGAGVGVEIELTERGLALTVPEEAVLFARGGSSVFVVGKRQGLAGSVARRRAVQLGARGNGRVEILGGVRPGERIIVSGVGFLDDEEPVEDVGG